MGEPKPGPALLGDNSRPMILLSCPRATLTASLISANYIHSRFTPPSVTEFASRCITGASFATRLGHPVTDFEPISGAITRSALTTPWRNFFGFQVRRLPFDTSQVCCFRHLRYNHVPLGFWSLKNWCWIDNSAPVHKKLFIVRLLFGVVTVV